MFVVCDTPIFLSNKLFLTASGTGQTPTNHNAYRSGFSAWCGTCHGTAGRSNAVWSVDPIAPTAAYANRGGGDFVFLQEDNINDGRGGNTNPIRGHAAGHSGISGIKNTVADPVLTTSPGGTYPAANLGCTSCHGPHGNASYRLLYQNGQRVGSVLFTSTVEAEGIALTASGTGETPTNHNAYRSGFSAWCGTCHGTAGRSYAVWSVDPIAPTARAFDCLRTLRGKL